MEQTAKMNTGYMIRIWQECGSSAYLATILRGHTHLINWQATNCYPRTMIRCCPSTPRNDKRVETVVRPVQDEGDCTVQHLRDGRKGISGRVNFKQTRAKTFRFPRGLSPLVASTPVLGTLYQTIRHNEAPTSPLQNLPMHQFNQSLRCINHPRSR